MKNIQITLQFLIITSFTLLFALACSNNSSKNTYDSKYLKNKGINFDEKKLKNYNERQYLYNCRGWNFRGFFKNSLNRFYDFAKWQTNTVTEHNIPYEIKENSACGKEAKEKLPIVEVNFEVTKRYSKYTNNRIFMGYELSDKLSEILISILGDGTSIPLFFRDTIYTDSNTFIQIFFSHIKNKINTNIRSKNYMINSKKFINFYKNLKEDKYILKVTINNKIITETISYDNFKDILLNS